jgi:enoyl-CoA hydratase
MLRTIETSRLVVIADIQGPAIGAGMQLAMAADLRVVGERGWFMIPPVKLGIAVDAWTIRRVRVLVGGARARTILLAAERMDQEEAQRCGLASYTGDADKAEEVALRIATYAPLSLAYHKAVLNDDETHKPLKDYQQELYDQVWSSEDAAEASKARAEKREPNFIGK